VHGIPDVLYAGVITSDVIETARSTLVIGDT
jgi:hypothetical protein